MGNHFPEFPQGTNDPRVLGVGLAGVIGLNRPEPGYTFRIDKTGRKTHCTGNRVSIPCAVAIRL